MSPRPDRVLPRDISLQRHASASAFWSRGARLPCERSAIKNRADSIAARNGSSMSQQVAHPSKAANSKPGDSRPETIRDDGRWPQ